MGRNDGSNWFYASLPWGIPGSRTCACAWRIQRGPGIRVDFRAVASRIFREILRIRSAFATSVGLVVMGSGLLWEARIRDA